MNLAVFYHCLLFMGEPPEFLPQAADIIAEQMAMLKSSGLEDAATEIHVGLNGSEESSELAGILLPAKAKITYHGLQCRNECRSIVMIEDFVKGHPDWLVLYHHSKSATHAANTDYAQFANRWRRCMERACVQRWRECVNALSTNEAVGAHWLTGQADGTQHYFAGTFFWATSNFLRTLPSIYERERIKLNGIDSLSSRYEAEVWIGNGPRLPRIKDMETSHGLMGCP